VRVEVTIMRSCTCAEVNSARRGIADIPRVFTAGKKWNLANNTLYRLDMVPPAEKAISCLMKH